MAMTYSTTLDPTAYTQQLMDFIKSLEGETYQPYVDTTGNPTIGWGFALNDAHITLSVELTDIIEQVLGINQNRDGLSLTAKASEAAFN